MIALVFLTFFLYCGWMIAQRVFAGYGPLIRAWIGILFGLAGMMWGVALFSFAFDFTLLSHFCAALLIGLPVWLMSYGFPKKKYPPQAEDPPRAISLAVIVFFYLVAALMLARTFNYHQGGVYAGLPNFSDLSFHLGMITGIAERKTFPPEYSIFAGIKTAFPFLINSLSAGLYLLGLPLKWAVLIPNLLLAWALIFGFAMVANDAPLRKGTVILAMLLFFLNGGFGFAHFLDGSKADPGTFTCIVDNSMYTTPCMWWGENIFLGNSVCSHMVNGRATLAGWAFLFLMIWLLGKALATKTPKFFFISGLIGGLLPMIHTISFFCGVIIALTWFAVYFFTAPKKIPYIKYSLFFIVPLLVLSLPQLFYWIFPHGAGATGKFMHLHFNWINKSDLWLWFWIKNAGIVSVLLIPALLSAGRDKLLFYSPAIVLFLLGDLVQLTPTAYDNSKIFMIWYAFSAALVADFLLVIYARLKGVRGGGVLPGMIILFGILAAAMTMVHDFATVHQVFPEEDLQAAAFIREHTPPDALFVSSPFHNNPITALAGRQTLTGYVGWMISSGLDYEPRFNDIRRIYTNPDDFKQLQRQYNIDYVYFSFRERREYKASPEYFDRNFTKIFSGNHSSLYAVSGKARRYTDSGSSKRGFYSMFSLPQIIDVGR